MANSALLEEARKRGLVPPGTSTSGLLGEARRRGLVPSGNYAPIPAPVKPELAPKQKETFPRSTYVGSGAAIGGIGGMPAGPPGMAAGGILGAAAGSYVYDLSQDIQHLVKGRAIPKRDIMEPTRKAAQEAYTEALWGPGTMAAGPLLRHAGKPLIGKMLGVLNPEARRITDLAHGQGVDLGVTHVSRGKLAKGLPRVLGVFPFVGTPYRRGQARVVGQLDEAAADVLNTLAPASTRYDVAKGLTGAAVKRYGKFNRVAAALYDRFYKIADSLPVKDIAPTQPLRDELAEVARREGIEQITLKTGEPFRAFGPDAVGDWLKQIDELPSHITVEQARGLERQLNSLLRQGGKEGWDVSRLSGMKQALQTTKASLDVSKLVPADASRVLGAWQNANEFFAAGRQGFETTTAKRFGRVDKNIFGKGIFKTGTVNKDQIFEAVYQAKSPEALSDLRTLVGPGEFKKATRKFLETTFDASRIPAKEGSLVGDMFSAADFEKRLGLGTQEGWDALGEMLKGSDVTVKDWRNFLEVAKAATDITIRDPSTFVMRRFVLGAGLAGSVAMGAGQISIPAATLITYMSRQGAKFLMSGNQLRLMTRVLSDTTSDHLRRTMLTRLLRISAEEEAPKKSGTPWPPRPL